MNCIRLALLPNPEIAATRLETTKLVCIQADIAKELASSVIIFFISGIIVGAMCLELYFLILSLRRKCRKDSRV